MKRANGLMLAAALLAVPIVAAQLKVDVQLVNVVATVTDEKGRYVPDLAEEDFILYEDGQAQTIAHFSQSNDLPVSVGVVLDTSGSMERKIVTATKAIERFIRTIHQDDDIFLLAFASRPQLRQDFTDNRDKLAEALRRITVGGGTALYDALYEGLRKIKHGKHEKKAILLITDGEDTSSEISFDHAALTVRESELLVYCLGISPGSSGPMTESAPYPAPRGGGGGGSPIPRRGPTISIPFPFPMPGGGRVPGGGGGRYPDPNDPNGAGYPPGSPPPPQSPRRSPGGVIVNPDTVDMDVLNTFADASGGKAWLLSGNWSEKGANEVQRALDEIAAELRNQYSIGYYPSHPIADGKWHRIEIRPRNRNYHARARKEYFGR